MNDLIKYLQDKAIEVYDAVIYSNFRSQTHLKWALASKRRILCHHDVIDIGDEESHYFVCTHCGLHI